ncbi:PVC-type heme-binding CxxCH protein [Candidatus Laterigemmans baculatus]|uniref:PVC-type heme-binding CxxCH protein n=1 Tax=Candidatus Laterigemmans baculatus TaxID=2770505 RepID=UPI0013DC572D|nr:PVC-type heme-binding CxxCH protein [Candidatus Laterigemmans baculatus]
MRSRPFFVCGLVLSLASCSAVAEERLAGDAASLAAARPLPAARRPTSGLSPREAARQFTAPSGFHVDLIAGEPELHQPVAFCFDARGRLWVAEAHTYPARAPEGEGCDAILIFEDSDDDGTFETRTVFAEGLNLISGLEVGYGGVWVGAAPYLMFIPDRDGDDRPDAAPQILLDGFGYQDTHETLNAFTWGPDGWLYGCQGVFTRSQIGPPGAAAGDRIPFNAGVWRYHPVLKKFEAFAQGTSNPWGLAFDPHGQAFITACVIPHTYHMIQGGRYQRQAGQHFDPYTFDDLKTIADHAHYAGNIRDHAWWGRDEPVEDDATSAAGGGHAHCGALIYQGDSWPAEYHGALLMHNLHGNRVNVDRLRGQGSGFVASHAPDLLFANDPWFRGIALQLGPDGAVYLIDWYDKNACHRTTPEIWDRTNGRMYRLRYGEHETRAVDLQAADNAQLIALHAHPNEWQSRMASRMLMERAARGEPLPGVRQQLWEGALSAAPSATRLRYLWSAHGIAPLGEAEVLALLDQSEAILRGWAIQLACERATPSAEVLERFVALAERDDSPVVRLYLASALQRLSQADLEAGNRDAGNLDAAERATTARWRIAEGLVAHAESQHDPNLPLMIWYGVSPLVASDTERAFDLASRCQIPLVEQFIYRRAASDPSLVGSLVAAIAADPEPTRSKVMLEQLAEAAPRLGKLRMPAEWPAVVQKTADWKDPAVRRAVQTLSVGFGDASIFPLLRRLVADRTAELGLRREALATLARGGDPQLESLALALLDDPPLRKEVLSVLGRFDSERIPETILARYATWEPEDRRAAIDALASRPAHAAALLAAVADERVPRTDVSAVHAGKIRQLGREEVDQQLTELWGVVGSTPAEVEQEIARMRKKYTAKVLAAADASRGRALYEKSCAQCHRLFGEGGEIGPDLTGANRGNLDYLLENILAPNTIVGKDYQAVSVLTVDGRVVTGLIRENSEAAIVLHDAEKLVTIPRSEIEAVTETVRSVMPEGILQTLSESQVADLLAYLQATSPPPGAAASGD